MKLTVLSSAQAACSSLIPALLELQAGQEEGVYAQGSVTVQPFPVEIHGPEAYKSFPVRRIERVVGDDEGAELTEHELQKVPPLTKRMLQSRCQCLTGSLLSTGHAPATYAAALQP